MTSIHYLFRISLPSVSRTIRIVSQALWAKLQPICLPPSNSIDWPVKAEEFNDLWNFPNCMGAIDGKHIAIQAPPDSGSLYYNYKNFFSIILLAICDAKYRFLSVDIGSPGRESDGGVFKRSAIGKKLEHGQFGVPSARKLPHSSTLSCNFIFVGDEAFPLKPYLLRPYPGRGREKLSPKIIIFNYRLSRARRTIENTFGLMAARMRIFRTSIVASLTTTKSIVMAAVCLHNYLQTSELATQPSARKYCPQNFLDFEDKHGNIHEGQWRKEIDPLPQVSQKDMGSSNNFTREADMQRNTLADYFFAEGSVPWQWEQLPTF